MLTFIQTRSQQSYFYPQHSNIHKTCLHCPLYFFTISGIHQHFFPLYIHMMSHILLYVHFPYHSSTFLDTQLNWYAPILIH